jgi:pSer/pThr/pTyr-binding forkhead associated (FHA) protein
MNLEWILLGFRILATIILYTFLGLAFYIIWRDLKRAGAKIDSQSEGVHQLRVTVAPDNNTLVVGDTLPLQPITLLGRAPENTIVIRQVAVSARHARLSWENGGWWLEDLGSRNGTTLNELPLSKPTPLTDGDIIGIGETQFLLETTVN